MSLFNSQSAFYDMGEPKPPQVVIANDIGQVGLEHRLTTRRHAAKEDAIHALRRIEHELRGEGLNRIADDLDAAIVQVIDL